MSAPQIPWLPNHSHITLFYFSAESLPPFHLSPKLYCGCQEKTFCLVHCCLVCLQTQQVLSRCDWWLVSYMILYMFQCHSPKSSHPLPLSQSPKFFTIWATRKAPQPLVLVVFWKLLTLLPRYLSISFLFHPFYCSEFRSPLLLPRCFSTNSG